MRTANLSIRLLIQKLFKLSKFHLKQFDKHKARLMYFRT